MRSEASQEAPTNATKAVTPQHTTAAASTCSAARRASSAAHAPAATCGLLPVQQYLYWHHKVLHQEPLQVSWAWVARVALGLTDALWLVHRICCSVPLQQLCYAA